MNVAIFVNIVNPRFRIFREILLAESELAFVDFQRLDAALKGSRWNLKLSRRSGRTGNPASTLGQRRLDKLPLASRFNIQSGQRFSPRCLRKSPFGKPQPSAELRMMWIEYRY